MFLPPSAQWFANCGARPIGWGGGGAQDISGKVHSNLLLTYYQIIQTYKMNSVTEGPTLSNDIITEHKTTFLLYFVRNCM
jgi:hypothetical protein